MDSRGGTSLRSWRLLCRDLPHRLLAAALALAWIAPTPFAARADDIPLTCGVPYIGSLERGEEKKFVLPPGSGTVVVDAVDVSGTLDLLKLDAGGGNRTCSGSLLIRARRDEEIGVEVSDCIGRDRGQFAVTASVVSQSSQNCSAPLPCGLTPTVQRLQQAGATRAYSFFGRAGDTVRIWAGKGLPREGMQRMRLRLFDPRGMAFPGMGGDSCGGQLSARLPADGLYTLLVSLCGKPEPSLYWLAFDSPACPEGPELTYLGAARADGTPLTPADYDDRGRPVYRLGSGSGFVLVFEGAPGRSRSPLGVTAYRPLGGTLFGWPDLEVLFSRPLGNGSPEVCDKQPPRAGGIPAVPSLEFDDTPAVRNAVNDFGCRVDDGTGQPQGVPEEYACTSFPNGEFHFVRPDSTLQFCAVVTSSWAFPAGATVVRARLRDQAGNVGSAREMVVEVEGPPPPSCPADCNGNGTVEVNEVITAVRIALGESDLRFCPAADLNQDLGITIDEILAAVRALLEGCP